MLLLLIKYQMRVHQNDHLANCIKDQGVKNTLNSCTIDHHVSYLLSYGCWHCCTVCPGEWKIFYKHQSLQHILAGIQHGITSCKSLKGFSFITCKQDHKHVSAMTSKLLQSQAQHRHGLWSKTLQFFALNIVDGAERESVSKH